MLQTMLTDANALPLHQVNIMSIIHQND